VRKALQKREKNFDYSSGSDVNPYSDEEVSLSIFFNLLLNLLTHVLELRGGQ
jgi:hypothetical protein